MQGNRFIGSHRLDRFEKGARLRVIAERHKVGTQRVGHCRRLNGFEKRGKFQVAEQGHKRLRRRRREAKGVAVKFHGTIDSNGGEAVTQTRIVRLLHE